MQLYKSTKERGALWLPMFLLFWLETGATALRCRTDDGPSEAELKRITRTCMRKISEQTRSGSTGPSYSFSNNKSKHNSNNNTFYGPLHQSNYGGGRYDYDDDDEPDDHYNYGNVIGNNYNSRSNSNNYNPNGSNNNRSNGNNRNILQQRSRDRQQNRGGSSSYTTASTYNERRYEYGNGYNDNGNSDSININSNNGINQRNSNNNRKTDNNKNNNDTIDASCVVHCFFEQMNMLNSDDFPDRYKVQYGLTRDLRDRELRNFYTDTIQDCFHYLESQRRPDKCHYSRDLINCMSEYAKANCDDWKEYSVIFN